MIPMHMPHARTYKGKSVRDQRQDLSSPIEVIAPETDVNMPIAKRERNSMLINERYIHGRRTVIRIGFEVYCRDGMRPLNYSRLPGKHVLLDCPSPEQARMAIDLVFGICGKLNGQLLAE